MNLRALAEAAAATGPGWIAADTLAAFSDMDDAPMFEPEDIALVVACSPDRIRALLDVVDAAEREDHRRGPDSPYGHPPRCPVCWQWWPCPMRAALDRWAEKEAGA